MFDPIQDILAPTRVSVPFPFGVAHLRTGEEARHIGSCQKSRHADCAAASVRLASATKTSPMGLALIPPADLRNNGVLRRGFSVCSAG